MLANREIHVPYDLITGNRSDGIMFIAFYTGLPHMPTVPLYVYHVPYHCATHVIIGVH